MRFCRNIRNHVIYCCLVAACLANCAQAQRFIEEIQAFKKQDSASFPPPNAILFIGSSSFRLWSDVQNYFPGHAIINRGFGGATIPDLIRYASEIIYPYNPRQIVIYCGENDMAEQDSASASEVLSRLKQLFLVIRKRLPGTSIVFVSIKPSPSRYLLMGRIDSANGMIREFLTDLRLTSFVDVYHEMLNVQGRPNPDLFLEDRLRMNRKGYFIWQKALEPYLAK